jgi:transcriptional regulator with XRE-family HTH domain
MDVSEIYKKIKAMRVLKDWSQEETANRLNLAVSSYAKIERGESDISLSRLAQIAKVMETDLEQLLQLNGHNILNILENCINYGKLQGNNIFLTETECVHELEKLQLLLTEREREIVNLKEQITHLKEMLDWAKSKG